MRGPGLAGLRGPLAQSVEHRTFNPLVVGSIATRPTIASAPACQAGRPGPRRRTGFFCCPRPYPELRMSADEAALSAEQVAHRNRIHAYGLVAGTMAVIAVAAILWFWL